MDLTNLLSNSQLLKQLAKEFKQLKLQKADVDYNAWMRQRLRNLATQQHQQPVLSSKAQPASNQQPSPAVIPPVNLVPSRHVVDIHSQPAPQPAAPTVAGMLQAASDRDRRLALSSALARQQVQLGIDPAQVAVTPEVVQAGTEQVLKLTQQLTQQQQDLLRMVQATQEQLREQKALIAGVLSQPPSAPPAALAPVCDVESAATYQATLHERFTPPQFTPPAWFIPPPSGTADQQDQTGAAGSCEAEQTGAAGAAQPVVQPGGHDSLQVLARCSPDGKLRTAHQQRKQALKATLKHMLTRGEAGGGEAGRDTRLLPDAAQQGQQPQTARPDAAVLRKVLRRLGWQQSDRQGAPAAAATYSSPPSHQPALDQLRQAAAPHQPPPPPAAHQAAQAWMQGGLSIADIEAEAAAVLQQDRAAAAERDRLTRLEQLESHLAAAVHQLHHQAHRLAHLQSGGAGAAGGLSHASSDGPGTADLIEPCLPLGSSLTSSGQHRLHSTHSTAHSGQTGGGWGSDGVTSTLYHTSHSSLRTADSEAAANPSLTLHRMLAQLQRLEEQESALRHKWLATRDGAVPAGEGGGAAAGQLPAAFSVKDGEVRPHLGRDLGPSATGAMPAGSVAGGKPAAGACEAAAAPGPPPAGLPASSHAHHVEVSRTDPISTSTVISVQEGRRRFLEYQSLVDGFLLGSSGGGLQPQHVVEDIADALLEEVLQEQAAEMLQLCDALGEHMLEQELQ